MEYLYPSRVSSSFPGVDEVYPPQETNNKISTLLKKLAVPVSSLLVGAALGGGLVHWHDDSVTNQKKDAHAAVRLIEGQLQVARDSRLPNHPKSHDIDRSVLGVILETSTSVIANDSHMEPEDYKRLGNALFDAENLAEAANDAPMEKRLEANWQAIFTNFGKKMPQVDFKWTGNPEI